MTPEEMRARLVEVEEEMLELRLQNAAIIQLGNTCYRMLRELEEDFGGFRGVSPASMRRGDPYEATLTDSFFITTWFISTINDLERVLKDVDCSQVTAEWNAELRERDGR